MKSKPNVPLGVRPSPSRFSPGGAMPLRPMFAVHGPNTWVQPEPLRSKAVSVARGEAYSVVTVITCWAAPMFESRVTRSGAGAVVGGAAVAGGDAVTTVGGEV